MSRKCSLTRVEYFSAAHRLVNTGITEQDNCELYGPCNNYHGHNYKLGVTVTGEICPTTGMVMNLRDLKEILQTRVLDILDHKNLELDVEYFRDGNVVSTTENLVFFIWTLIRPHLRSCLDLKVKLHETKKNSATYSG